MHIQPQQIVCVVGVGLLHLGTLGIGTVHFAAAGICCGKCGGFKVARVIQHPNAVRRILKFRHGNAGDLGGNDFPFCGVVVHKDEAFRQQGEFRRSLYQIPVFRLPVGFDCHEVVLVQDRIGVRKSQSGVFRFVFGADREEYAQLFLCLAVLLYLGVCLRFGGFLPDRDALLSVVADDTAPEGVVQVQSQHLFVLAVNGANDSRQAVGKFRNCVQRHGVFVEVPVGIVVPCVQPVACRQIVYIVNVEVVVCGGILSEFPVQFRDEPHHAVAVPPVAVAHEPRCRQFKVVL